MFPVGSMQKSPIFRFSIKEMGADRNDDLPGKYFGLLNTVPQEPVVVSAIINDGSDNPLDLMQDIM